jgi:hypothetical protein
MLGAAVREALGPPAPELRGLPGLAEPLASVGNVPIEAPHTHAITSHLARISGKI